MRLLLCLALALLVVHEAQADFTEAQQRALEIILTTEGPCQNKASDKGNKVTWTENGVKKTGVGYTCDGIAPGTAFANRKYYDYCPNCDTQKPDAVVGWSKCCYDVSAEKFLTSTKNYYVRSLFADCNWITDANTYTVCSDISMNGGKTVEAMKAAFTDWGKTEMTCDALATWGLGYLEKASDNQAEYACGWMKRGYDRFCICQGKTPSKDKDCQFFTNAKLLQSTHVKKCQPYDAKPCKNFRKDAGFSYDKADKDETDIETKDAKDWEACRDLCQVSSQCQKFTFADSKCTLKNFLLSSRNAKEAQSGFCDDGAAKAGSGACKMEVDTDYPGNDLGGQNPFVTPTAEDCCKRCRKNKECKQFTWVARDKNCWMKGTLSTSGQKVTGCYSGVNTSAKK